MHLHHRTPALHIFCFSPGSVIQVQILKKYKGYLDRLTATFMASMLMDEDAYRICSCSAPVV